MKFHRFCILAMCVTASHAFTTSSNSNRKSLVVRHSTTVHQSTKSWADLHEFNIALDKLAEQCSNSNQPVIAKAAECQELWENQQVKNDEKITPDTISFNTVLKAWNRCCNTLSESTRHSKIIPSDYKSVMSNIGLKDFQTSLQRQYVKMLGHISHVRAVYGIERELDRYHQRLLKKSKKVSFFPEYHGMETIE